MRITDPDDPGHEAIVDRAVALLRPFSAEARAVGPGARAGRPPPIPPDRPPSARPAATDAPLEFTAVYDQHFAFVWRSLRRLGVPDRLLDDAAQDVFIVVHRRLDGFEGRSTVKSWLFGIARRVAHDHRRRVGRKERTDLLPESVTDPDATTPAHDAERAQAVRVLHEILAALDDDKREVFVLAELEQMTVPEIADAIDANVNTVYSRLRAARQAFERQVARRLARGGQP
jgi:RNA polymerase sigma-70 factor, ECF subfamily